MVGTLKVQDGKFVIQRLNGELYPLHKDDYTEVGKLLSFGDWHKCLRPNQYRSITHVEFRFKSDRYGIVVYGYIERKIDQIEFREHVLKQLIHD